MKPDENQSLDRIRESEVVGAQDTKETATSIFEEQYRVVGVESDRLLVRGILSGEVLTIIHPEPGALLTQNYPLGKLIALTDPSMESYHA